MTVQEIIRLVSDAGVIGLLVISIYGGFKRWYVWGWMYAELKAENKELRTELREHNRALGRSVQVTGKAVEQVRQGADIG